jgi:hypothetical protein
MLGNKLLSYMGTFASPNDKGKRPHCSTFELLAQVNKVSSR